jgi:hypothetical protein
LWPLRVFLVLRLLCFFVERSDRESHSWLSLSSLSLLLHVVWCALLRLAPKFGTHNPFRGCVYLTKGLPWSLFGPLKRNCLDNRKIIPGALWNCYESDSIKLNSIYWIAELYLGCIECYVCFGLHCFAHCFALSYALHSTITWRGYKPEEVINLKRL